MTLNKKMRVWIDSQVAAVILVKKEILAHENLLMISKWPAYKFMTPLAATQLFADEYAKAYKNCLRQNVDITVAQNSKAGMSFDISTASGPTTQMWIARQRADATGLPYPEYLEFCFWFATRRQRRHLPQPNQLTGSDTKARAEFVNGLGNFWDDDRRRSQLNQMPIMPQYQVDGGRILPGRLAFVATLAEAQMMAPNLEVFVGNYVVARGYLDEANLGAHLSPERAASVVELARSSGEWVSETKFADAVDLFQACYGLPGINADTAELCDKCPSQAACAELRNAVEEEVFAATGSLDPRLEHAKTMNRKHVQDCRARKKAGIVSSLSSTTTVSAFSP